jgi:hypothetical protein
MHSKDIKHLGTGLGIGAFSTLGIIGLLFLIPSVRINILSIGRNQPVNPAPLENQPQDVLLIATAQVLPTASPVIFTETPSIISSPTLSLLASETPSIRVETPLPSPTQIDSSGLITSGQLAIVGPLTQDEQIRLYQASLTFIAPTLADSKKMSVEINQLRFSDPSTTCGPLSIAILQKAGLLSSDFVPHDYFLINPDNGLDRILIEKAFPNSNYENTRYKIRLNKVNWFAQPLMSGDFLYIYSGEEGNFEHMLVVSRVDALGRAYSVTNYNTEVGFIINEVMLYDPADPTAGIFAQWTQRKDQLLGSTGFAGYEVWRRVQQ